MSIAILLLAATSLAQGGIPAQPAPSFLASVQELDSRFVRDLHDKNIDDALTLYADDEVFVNPDGTVVRTAGMRKLYETVTATFDSDLHLDAEKLSRTGSTAEETGAFTETLRHRDSGKLDQISGTYRFLLRRDSNGHWLYTRMEWH